MWSKDSTVLTCRSPLLILEDALISLLTSWVLQSHLCPWLFVTACRCITLQLLLLLACTSNNSLLLHFWWYLCLCNCFWNTLSSIHLVPLSFQNPGVMAQLPMMRILLDFEFKFEFHIQPVHRESVTPTPRVLTGSPASPSASLCVAFLLACFRYFALASVTSNLTVLCHIHGDLLYRWSVINYPFHLSAGGGLA